MSNLNGLEKNRVFYYFEKICSIPHGSGNMDQISDYCVEFAKEHNLKFYNDEAKNVIIYKDGSKGYENSQPIILQGHMDMVCQKTPDSNIDFLKDGLDIFVDGDFIRAKNTTLGADNGIAVAMMLDILESDDICHPPIEAVFTTDEEIGMLGAGKLDMEKLSAKRMLNLDMGKNDEALVSCAGGVEVKGILSVSRVVACGKKIDVVIEGLKGGHSGGDINRGRVNANILAGRILTYAKKLCDFDILSINGGNKGNVIPSYCEISLVVGNEKEFITKMEDYFDVIKEELSSKEENLKLSISVKEDGNFNAFDKETRDKIIYLLTVVPNGMIETNEKIRNDAETSLNLGILETCEDKIVMMSTLRSNRKSALDYLEERMFNIYQYNGLNVESLGYYPPWEYTKDAELHHLYKECYKEMFGVVPDISAIHAGLECGIFSSKIEGLSCIAIGPDMFDIHTVNEKLSISKTEEFYKFLLYFLSKCN